MKLFYIVHSLGGDHAVSSNGQDKETNERLMTEQGWTFDLIDEKTYQVFVDLHKPVLNSVDLTQDKAILKNKSAIPADRLDSLIKILGL